MRTKLLILASAIHLPAQLLAAEAAKPIPFETHDGYFVSNKFEPKEPISFVVLKEQKSFDEVFGIGMVMRDKSHRLAPNTFESKIVVSAIHRGKAMVTYRVQSMVTEAQTLIVNYSAKSEPNATAEFSCPLILSLDRADFTKVRFIENGKEIKNVTLSATPGNKSTNIPQTLLPEKKSADGKTVYLIPGPGIGQAKLACHPEMEAQEIVLKLKLRGLESLTLANDQLTWKASVLSHSGHRSLIHLWKDGKEGPLLTKESPEWTDIRALDAEGKAVAGLPPENGSFELTIPKALLKGTRELNVSWIDFYR